MWQAKRSALDVLATWNSSMASDKIDFSQPVRIVDPLFTLDSDGNTASKYCPQIATVNKLDH
jgi:hypothetical protein